MAGYQAKFAGNQARNTSSNAAAPAPASAGAREQVKSIKTHNITFRKKGAGPDAKSVNITGFFQDEGQRVSKVSITPAILDALRSLEVGDKLYLWSEDNKAK